MKNYMIGLLVLAGTFASPVYAQEGEGVPPQDMQKKVLTATCPNKSSFTRGEMGLNESMQRLMSDHVTWQRIFAIETITGAKDNMKARDRLDKNVSEIGNAFEPFYGKETAGKISDLFKQHVKMLADYTATAKSKGNTRMLGDQLMANADKIAEFLAQKNTNWNQKDLSNLFRAHTNDLKNEVDAQVANPGAIDVAQMDKTSADAALIATTLTSGLINQFPDKLK